jgi:hypothetical protein
VDLVPRLGTAIDGRILAHRRHDDAVARGDGAKRDGLEQQRRRHGWWHSSGLQRRYSGAAIGLPGADHNIAPEEIGTRSPYGYPINCLVLADAMAGR